MRLKAFKHWAGNAGSQAAPARQVPRPGPVQLLGLTDEETEAGQVGSTLAVPWLLPGKAGRETQAVHV